MSVFSSSKVTERVIRWKREKVNCGGDAWYTYSGDANLSK